MAFPYIFESNFEQGSSVEWDSETDTASQLDFPHYTELARFQGSHYAPYAGAYSMRAMLSGGTADAFVEEGDMNIAADGAAYVAFNVMFSSDFDATANDTVHLFELQGAADAIQAVVGFRYVAATDVINIGFGELTPTGFSTMEIQKNTWYTIELAVTLDDGASNDGTLDLYITRVGDAAASSVSATQIASLDQIAVTHGVLGVLNQLATTTGSILFDRFIMDDARVYPNGRYNYNQVFTTSGHAFVGPGWIDSAALLTDEASNSMKVWDTDTANTDDLQGFVLEFDIDGNYTASVGHVYFQHGCYVELSGTDPRGQVTITLNSDVPGVHGPKYFNDALVRLHGV